MELMSGVLGRFRAGVTRRVSGGKEKSPAEARRSAKAGLKRLRNSLKKLEDRGNQITGDMATGREKLAEAAATLREARGKTKKAYS